MRHRGAFVLPDSFVIAALAVEDTAASVIDDRDGRTWELLRMDAGGKVLLPALDQRANDQMGRSWEEVFATGQRMVSEHPDSIAAWSYLATTQGWMGLPADSIAALHAPRIRAFGERLRAQAAVAPEDLGRIFWYADGIDSTARARADLGRRTT